MEKLNQYIALTVVACLAVLGAGWFLLVSPKRGEATDARAAAAAQEAANASLETQLQMLRAQAKDLPRQQAKLASVAAKIPDNPAMPSLVRALVAAGTSAGVELVSLTRGAPAVAAGSAPAAPAAAGVAPSAPVVAPQGPNSAGVLAVIPVTLSVSGGYFQIEQFLNNLENLPRAMRVTAVTAAPGVNPLKPQLTGKAVDDGRNLTGTITAEVFMAASRPAPTPVVVPGQPVASGTPTVAPSPLPSASPSVK